MCRNNLQICPPISPFQCLLGNGLRLFLHLKEDRFDEDRGQKCCRVNHSSMRAFKRVKKIAVRDTAWGKGKKGVRTVFLRRRSGQFRLQSLESQNEL